MTLFGQQGYSVREAPDNISPAELTAIPISTPRRSGLQSKQPEQLLLFHCNGWWATHEFLVIRR